MDSFIHQYQKSLETAEGAWEAAEASAKEAYDYKERAVEWLTSTKEEPIYAPRVKHKGAEILLEEVMQWDCETLAALGRVIFTECPNNGGRFGSTFAEDRVTVGRALECLVEEMAENLLVMETRSRL